MSARGSGEGDDVDIPKPRCQACNEVIDMQDGDTLRMFDLPHLVAEQLARRSEDYAQGEVPDYYSGDKADRRQRAWEFAWQRAELLACDGHFMMHDDCADDHWTDEYFMEDVEFSTEDEEKADLVRCPVCDIHVARRVKDECPRCGKALGEAPEAEV